MDIRTQQQIVEATRKLAQQAVAGNVRAVAFVAYDTSGVIHSGHLGCVDCAYVMVGGLDMLQDGVKAEFQHALARMYAAQQEAAAQAAAEAAKEKQVALAEGAREQ